MKSLMRRYKQVISQPHGWNVEIACDRCKSTVMPRYEGWSLSMAHNAVDGAAVYAKLACPVCGHRLINEAGSTLVKLFNAVPIPEQNLRIVKEFVVALVLVPVFFAFVLFIGVQMDWWGNNAFALLVLSAVLIPLLVMRRNYRIAMLRTGCACGNPQYLFMGQLNGTYCYRCSSCGGLKRLRD